MVEGLLPTASIPKLARRRCDLGKGTSRLLPIEAKQSTRCEGLV